MADPLDSFKLYEIVTYKKASTEIDTERFPMMSKNEDSKQSVFIVLRFLGLLFFLLIVLTQETRSQTEKNVTYADLAPIFSQHCVLCHSTRSASASAGLRLDNYNAILKGSGRGVVVKAGEPSSSELIRRIKGISQPRMPMTGPPFLTGKQIAMFERWVASGMPRGKHVQSKLSRQSAGTSEWTIYQDVAPIFARRCVKCHTEKGLMGSAPEGYRLTSYKETLSASDRVRVVPGNIGASELVRRIRGQAFPRMPHDGPPYLTNSEIQRIENWIAQGARDSNGKPAAVPVGAAVRLHGTLGSHWKLDGLELLVSPGTRIDKSPAAGDYVEVRGRLNYNGEVNVERLRRR